MVRPLPSLVALALAVATALAGLGGCAVYDESLLEDTSSGTTGTPGGSGGAGGQGGDGGAGAAGGASGSGGQGGTTGCSSPSQCPGADTDCGVRTCSGGVCGAQNEPSGTTVGDVVVGGCKTRVCDGGGGEQIENKSPGVACTQGGGKKCTADGDCVACLVGADCASLICTDEFSCAPAECGDNVKNGQETDTDCGGAQCPKCGPTKTCALNTDCLGGLCSGTVCAATCSDGVKNGLESDVDCGAGGACPKCDYGKTCSSGAQCGSGFCSAASKCGCAPLGDVLISEVRSRGLGGGNDDFVELFNPTGSAVVLDSTWKLEARSSAAGTYGLRWTGASKTIPAYGHYLIVGTAYAGQPASDGVMSSGITDASAVRLVREAQVMDTVCYCYNETTCTALGGAGYGCEGTPATNPNTVNTNKNASIERKPGGASGNCIDTNNNAADFVSREPSFPQSTLSATTPP